MSTHKFEFSGASSSRTAAEQEHKLLSEVADLEKRLHDKKVELDEIQKHIAVLIEARRDKDKEKALSSRLKTVFRHCKDLSCLVDPEGKVEIEFGVKSLFSEDTIKEVMNRFTDGELTSKHNTIVCGAPILAMTFPYAKLESVMRGLELSQPVDLRRDTPRFAARC